MQQSSYASKQVFAPAPRSAKKDRTAQRIESELLALLQTRAFDGVALSELADRCGIARSTVYRLYANTTEILWALSRASFAKLLEAALSADSPAFAEAFRTLGSAPGLVAGLGSAKASVEIQAKLRVLAESAVELKNRSHDKKLCGLLMAVLLMGILEESRRRPVQDAELGEVVQTLYMLVFLTPNALTSIAVDRAKRSTSSHFPPAVSIAQSLAHDEYIVSMIDGRSYKSLRKHIARFGFTPEQYRACFSLAEDYPMVAPAYSRLRRAIASRSIESRAAA